MNWYEYHLYYDPEDDKFIVQAKSKDYGWFVPINYVYMASLGHCEYYPYINTKGDLVLGSDLFFTADQLTAMIVAHQLKQ